MQTKVLGSSKSVTIDGDGPFVIIGESINPTRRKKLVEAYTQCDLDYVFELAQIQLDSGADILDVNVGVPGIDEVGLLPEVVTAIAERFDAPLSLDSPNPEALAAALAAAPGRPLVNSVNGEEASLEAILPLVKEHGVPVIGLVMDDSGISMDPDKRISIAGKILERAAQLGIPAEDVIIDPLVMAVGADTAAGPVVLQTIEGIKREFGVNIALGASNVSFGLPDRHTINQVFLAVAISKGASCAITNPVKLTATIRATDMVLGRDDFAMRFIQHFRQQQKRQKSA